MMEIENLKYDWLILDLISKGYVFPFESVFEIEKEMPAFRFGFESFPEKNHTIQYLEEPKRFENKENIFSYCALSCYNSQANAEKRYKELAEAHSNFRKLTGDSLFFGVIKPPDGCVTKKDKRGHFDLFEYKNFHASDKFKFFKRIQMVMINDESC
ncbi:hypothetical protein [Methanolapillus millepedarum]|uniref:Uncharacterized protein n=1 Tax=Methanolapillus millepedarum TaxID=3028296 RepID=A0AA96V5H6_9EURY|nr:hypothetical protein MsAc7_14860 [Methanosarcinaceae archaeon Ac7]